MLEYLISLELQIFGIDDENKYFLKMHSQSHVHVPRKYLRADIVRFFMMKSRQYVQGVIGDSKKSQDPSVNFPSQDPLVNLPEIIVDVGWTAGFFQ